MPPKPVLPSALVMRPYVAVPPSIPDDLIAQLRTVAITTAHHGVEMVVAEWNDNPTAAGNMAMRLRKAAPHLPGEGGTWRFASTKTDKGSLLRVNYTPPAP